MPKFSKTSLELMILTAMNSDFMIFINLKSMKSLKMRIVANMTQIVFFAS